MLDIKDIQKISIVDRIKLLTTKMEHFACSEHGVRTISSFKRKNGITYIFKVQIIEEKV